MRYASLVLGLTGVLLAAGCGGGDDSSGGDTPTVTVSGVNVPALSPDCLGQDKGDQWLSSPWFQDGRVVALDKEKKVITLTAAEATARGLADDPVEGVWLCPPA
jgi:hypothetical protein